MIIQYNTSVKEKDMKILCQMKSYKWKILTSVYPYVNRWFTYILNLENSSTPSSLRKERRMPVIGEDQKRAAKMIKDNKRLWYEEWHICLDSAVWENWLADMWQILQKGVAGAQCPLWMQEIWATKQSARFKTKGSSSSSGSSKLGDFFLINSVAHSWKWGLQIKQTNQM